MHRSIPVIVALCAVLSCRGQIYQGSGGEVVDGLGQVVMRSATGHRLGTLRVRDVNGAAHFFGVLDGIPSGAHGIHLHAVGICNAPSFDGAGGHYNPRDRHHGLENPEGPHAGDAPNLESNEAKRATVDVTFAQPTSNGSNHSGLWDPDGASIVIHADPDDQKTDPAGNSGARIACGVVTRAR